MRLYPDSLLGRNVLLLAGLIMVGQVLGALVFVQFVQRPRIEQFAENIANGVFAVDRGLRSLAPEARAAFVVAFNASQGTEPDSHSGNAVVRALRPSVERFMVRQVSARLARLGVDAVWREEDGSRLYVRLRVDGTEHWLVTGGMYWRTGLPRAALLAWMASALLAVLGAMLIQGRINRPLRQLSDAAAAIERGDTPLSMPEDGPRELRTVARGFNRMTTALAAGERERAIMLAGISHDLRTPLAKLRLAVELSGNTDEPGLAADMARHCRQIDSIIDQFLDFARNEGDEAAVHCDLPALLRDVLDDAGASADFRLDVSPLPALQVRRNALSRLLTNLIENARRHGAPDFVLSARTVHGAVRISILDRGPGIAHDRVATLLQPFARGDAARGGTPGAGLGLAIAERIARLHHGQLELLPREGGGLEARLTLPAAPTR